MSEPLAELRSFPKASAPNDNASAIRGNCSIEHKQLTANILMRNGAGEQTTWGHDIIKRMRIVETNVRTRQYASALEVSMKRLEAEVVYEVAVQEGMLNYRGFVAGSCIGHLVDICTIGAMYVLGIEQGRDPSGVSLAVGIQYFGMAFSGTTLGIVATTISDRGEVLSSRVEIYNKNTGKLIATGVHSFSPRKPEVPASSGSARQARM